MSAAMQSFGASGVGDKVMVCQLFAFRGAKPHRDTCRLNPICLWDTNFVGLRGRQSLFLEAKSNLSNDLWPETSANGHTRGVRDMTALGVRVLTAIFIYFFAWGTYAHADRRVALVIGNSEYETRLR